MITPTAVGCSSGQGLQAAAHRRTSRWHNNALRHSAATLRKQKDSAPNAAYPGMLEALYICMIKVDAGSGTCVGLEIYAVASCICLY